MIIPFENLDSDTLQSLLSDIVTRDGTDYGDTEVNQETKIRQALRALSAGNAFIVFDEETETVNLLTKDQIPHQS